jgi:hypothetical protein
MHGLIEHHKMQDRKLVIQYLTYIDSDSAFYRSKLAAFDMQITDCFTVDTKRIEEETGYSPLRSDPPGSRYDWPPASHV